MLQGARAAMSPVDALQSFFEHNFAGAQGAGTARGHWGCMLINTVLEMAGVDDPLAARASDHLSEVQRIFRASLEEAGAAPEQAEELGAMLMLVMEGARVSSRRRLPEAQQLQPIATTFKLVRNALA
jgi:TetR/AcrR family transcriptional regulator, transcriptional repressor for nem operon